MSHPLKALFAPARHLSRAVWVPLQALVVLAICTTVNLMTSPNHLWVKWVALGLGISVLLTWLRAARTLASLALAAAAVRWLQRRLQDGAAPLR